jgi:long-chain-fatty-acid--[acyl-carrier-protein] ligase
VTLIEGYGITECSPIVAINDMFTPRKGTIGFLLPSLEYAIINPETEQQVGTDETGMLLLRGPSIFSGYRGDAPSPFMEFAGKHWYRTGDLVSMSDDGLLTFRGRLKRFVKLGGEMISLPAIESVLQGLCNEDDGPSFAVVATADESHPELVLFTTRTIEREIVNQHIREAGLSSLHSIRRIIQIETIPVLGSGKTDYRSLQELLNTEASYT